MSKQSEQLSKAVSLLNEHNAACVIVKKDDIKILEGSGIRPLILALKENERAFKNAVIADRVIGKAAALIMVYGKVNRVYARIISVSAQKVFESAGVLCSFDKSAEFIKNRDGTGQCPMEKLCLNIDNPEIAFQTLCSVINL